MIDGIKLYAIHALAHRGAQEPASNTLRGHAPLLTNHPGLILLNGRAKSFSSMESSPSLSGITPEWRMELSSVWNSLKYDVSITSRCRANRCIPGVRGLEDVSSQSAGT